MSDQPRTAAAILRNHFQMYVDIYQDRENERFAKHSQTAAQALYDDLLARLPGEHPYTDIPSDRLNPQEDGEVIGYNQAIDDCKAILRAYFLAGKDGAV